MADLDPAWRPRLQLVDVVRMKVAELAHPATRSRQMTCVHKTYQMHKVSMLGRRLPEGAATVVEAKTKDNKRSSE